MMYQRQQLQAITTRLSYYPGVVLLGARQVGKSTLARTVAASHPEAVLLDLELPEDRARLAHAPAFFATNKDKLVILDEVQTMPDLFSQLRPEIDADRRPGRFLMLGSASGKLLRQSAESLAGRVSYVELAPLLLNEVTPEPLQPSAADLLALLKLWQRGGFPLSFTAPNDAMSLLWRRDFIQTFLQRDLPNLGVGIASETLHRFWRMLAHNHGQLFNASQLGQALGGMSHTAVTRYLDVLCDAMVVRRLEPLQINLGKRLVKSPKVYVRDSGVLHALLGIGSTTDLQGHPVGGHSWEGLVLEHIAAYAPPDAQLSFYRTAAGAELDVVVEHGGRKTGFEMKLSSAPKVSRGFWQACEDTGISKAYVVAPVSSGWMMEKSVQVIPLRSVANVFAI